MVRSGVITALEAAEANVREALAAEKKACEGLTVDVAGTSAMFRARVLETDVIPWIAMAQSTVLVSAGADTPFTVTLPTHYSSPQSASSSANTHAECGDAIQPNEPNLIDFNL